MVSLKGSSLLKLQKRVLSLLCLKSLLKLMSLNSLLRFLQSLHKLLSLRPRGAVGGLPRASTPQWAQALVNETLEDLGAHTNCMSVAWSAARNSFKVVRKSDKAKKEFCVKGLKGK